MPQAETVHRLYYSNSGGLKFWIRKPRYLQMDGGKTITDEGPMVEFMPQSDGFGRYSTDDPEIIEALDKRIKEVGDVISPDEYVRRITPIERQLDSSKREIERQNDLIEKLKRDLAALQQRDKQNPPAQVQPQGGQPPFRK